MTDSFTHVSHQSWSSRIGSSIKGILFGLLLFIGAFPLLFWNEGRAIDTEKSLKEGAAAVISVDANHFDPVNNDHLVYLSGLVSSDEVLRDDLFHIETPAISLSRRVQVYQWQEHSESKTEKELGGSTKTTTTYNYSKGWSGNLINSSSFKHPEDHQNPAAKAYNDNVIYAANVTLGEFTLNSLQIREISGSRTIPLTEINIPENSAAVISQGEVYVGNPDTPQIGDTRITFSEIKPAVVSIVAAQQNKTFAPYMTSVGQSIQLLSTGLVSAQEMFASELADNTLLTWGLRLLGFVLMAFGLSMIMKPLTVIADVVPFIGNLLELGTGLISGIIAFALSLTTIAIAWIFYRPLVAAVLIALVIGSLVYLKKKVKKVNTAVSEQTVSVPPPPPA